VPPGSSRKGANESFPPLNRPAHAPWKIHPDGSRIDAACETIIEAKPGRDELAHRINPYRIAGKYVERGRDPTVVAEMLEHWALDPKVYWTWKSNIWAESDEQMRRINSQRHEEEHAARKAEPGKALAMVRAAGVDTEALRMGDDDDDQTPRT